MLELKQIKKDYLSGENCVHALNGIDIQFRESEFVSILGPSGCGKTTLLNIIGASGLYLKASNRRLKSISMGNIFIIGFNNGFI